MRASFPGVACSFLAVLCLVTAACSPAAAPAPQPKATAPAPAGSPESVATKPAAAGDAPTATPKPAAEGPRYGGIVTRALSRDVDTLDVHRGSGTPVSSTMFNIYQGLVRLDPMQHEKILPELAEKWDVTPDGKTYTFAFYKGVKWHDGQPFTMDDVKYSLEKMQNPKAFKTISPRGEGFLSVMDAAEIAGDNSLKITTRTPSASFLPGIASGWVAIEPKHILTVKGDMTKDAVGTGAFKLKKLTPDVSLELEKNPNYHVKGLPYLDGITFYTIKDGSTRFAALRTRKTLITFWGAGSLTPVETEIVRREMPDKIVVYEHDSLTRQIISFNTERKPWNDVRVRKAIDLAFDRHAAVKVNGRGYVGSVFPPPWGMTREEVAKVPGYRQAKEADIAEAKKLLAEAGVPTGFKTTMNTWNSGQYLRQAELAKDQLGKIGIDAEIVALENVVREDRAVRSLFDMDSYRWTDNTGDPDETLYGNYFTGRSHNYSHFSDKQVDELIDKQARALDPAARKAILSDIEKRLMDQVPVLIEFWDVSQTGAWKEVRNFDPGPGLHPWGKFDMMWLAQ